MNWKKLASMAALVGAAFGCGGSDDGGGNGGADGGNNPGGGDTYFYVVSQAGLGSINSSTTPKTAPGFNLDGSDTNESCASGAEDYQSGSPDNVTGVDNQLLVVADGVKDLLAEFNLDELLAMGILDGDIVLLFEVSGVNSLTDDDSVTLKAYLGAVPGQSSDGGDAKPMSNGTSLTAGQTFNLRGAALATATGSISGGRITVKASSLPLNIPALGEVIALTLKNVEMRFDITSSGLARGVIGGSVTTAQAKQEIGKFADQIGGSTSLINTTIDGFADLEGCTAISAALTFNGVTAVKGDTVAQ
ncbi:MAG: hypothetical protein R3A78_15800 [Polyangiales bacterium]